MTMSAEHELVLIIVQSLNQEISFRGLRPDALVDQTGLQDNYS